MSDLYSLPSYPCLEDVWDKLKKESRPIAVYGMGNGADKLFRRFEKYGIKVAEVFASDGFVRGHSFRGFKVKSFSEIKATYPEFVIVLSFASNRKEVVDMLSDIDEKYEMYVPDMPVADEDEYFDREFYNSHYEDILRVRELFADGRSREIYSAVINYRLSGKMKYLLAAITEKEEMYSLISEKEIGTVIDLGAYNGDTAREAIEYFPSLKKIYAVEPDPKNYKRLLKFSEKCECDIETVCAAAWSECGSGGFSGSGNRNSSISSTASYQHKELDTELVTVDSLCSGTVDYIKYDVEGAEYEVLVGSIETVKRESPALLVSLYHRSRDIFSLPNFVSRNFKGYKLYLRRMYSIPAWELNLLAIPT